jgi:hypothetical protein
MNLIEIAAQAAKVRAEQQALEQMQAEQEQRTTAASIAGHILGLHPDAITVHYVNGYAFLPGDKAMVEVENMRFEVRHRKERDAIHQYLVLERFDDTLVYNPHNKPIRNLADLGDQIAKLAEYPTAPDGQRRLRIL